jgi:hypothetical protein
MALSYLQKRVERIPLCNGLSECYGAFFKMVVMDNGFGRGGGYHLVIT